jgi:Fe-S-cluster containining protein
MDEQQPLAGACNGCGACCRVLTLAESPEQVRQMAALTRVLGIPSDHQFAAEHWRPLTRDEAMRRNPFYTSRLPSDAHLYACDRLGDDGRCTAYDERPLVCRGYPWYGAPPRDMVLADPECGYLVDVPDRSRPR